MYEIRPLLELDPDDIRRLNAGYTSTEKYAVSKVETDETTLFELELVPLDEPYERRWKTDDEELADFQRVVAAGFSLAAYRDGRMVAVALAEPAAFRTLWVMEFHVELACQGQGLGRELMEALAGRARQAGLRVMRAETQNTNIPAIRFYRKVGFSLDALDLSFYTNRDVEEGEVAVFMKRKLE